MTKLRMVTAGAGSSWEGSLVQACQQHSLGAEVVQRCYDLGDLLATAASGQAEVAVVGASNRWLDKEAVCRLGEAAVAVVAVVSAGDDGSERRLRQMGVQHVVTDADPPAALVAVARVAITTAVEEQLEPVALVPDPGGADRQHRRIVAVWGAKGAPGRTTVAVNLAFEAAAFAGETLLVDADTYGGAIAQSLGYLDDCPGLAWAARLANRGELDVLRLWSSTRRASSSGPRVLAGLPRAELWTEVGPGTWESLLGLFRVAFPLTVLDVGFCLEEDEELLYDQVRFRRNAVSRLALEEADLILAVVRADPVGIHDFIRGYQQLRDLTIEPDRIRVVVNQLRPNLMGNDTADQIGAALERYVGRHRVWFVPYDRAALDAALMAGQAVREARPGSPAHRAFAALAADLLAREPTGRVASSRRRWRIGSTR